MSEANVETARRSFERLTDAYNRGDVEAFVAELHPEVVWEENHPVFGFIGLDAAYEGHAGARRWWKASREPWADLEVSLEDMRRVAEDNYVVRFTLRGKGADSGIPVEMTFFHVHELCEGKIIRRRLYPERAEALEAAGLGQ